ncbi:methyl-accepting chemotaxis protein [Shumkonia mesophila]|uniref:methyl-accepting chemotaxis protein n=1 Tax=Shumkonia mesophila TaxID=2838854 RepID=UPI0029344CAD|nr:cache domain-containing protein [Shumkonia mesophila]
MFKVLRRLSLAQKMTLLTVAGIVLVTVAVVQVATYILESQMRQQAQFRQDANMRVAWELLRHKGSTFRVENGKLYADSHEINGNFEVVDRVKDLVGGTATIFMGDTRVSTNVVQADGKRAVGTKLAQGPIHDTLFQAKKAFRGEADILGEKYFTAYDPITSATGDVIGILYVGLRQSEFLDVVSEVRNSIFLAAVVLGGVVAVLALVFVRRQFRPLGLMTEAMGRLQRGDTGIAVPGLGRADEIGRMAASVQVFKDNAIEKARLEAEQKEKDRRAEAEKRAAMVRMADQFETSVGEVVGRVSSAATEMQSSSEAMSATAEEATRQASAVAAASEQASANVETVASAAEELSSSISEISRQVTQASQIASAAVSEAEQTNVKVQGLAQAANKIGEVVALITDIAEQTNLLALNATIEAARAGDAGKGFAVVASEVKNLANQTAKATDEIGAQIAGIQSATQEAVSAIESITRTISRINEVNAGVASAVEEQGAATQEIARNVEQAAAGTQEVSSNIAGVSQAANETGAAATQIQSTAADLSRQAETLRAEVDKFLASVRAG